jgi:3-hydroxyacyl-CoA dehydrogenase
MTIQVISISPPPSQGGRNNPLNPLSKQTRKHISQSLKQAFHDPTITSIILYGGSNFSAGADISEFSSKNNIESNEEIPSITDLCNLIESHQSQKPIIAAITGVALGGGLELSLACHFRVATSNSRIGLPEVNIGLIPGAGGTQRLGRVCHGGNISWVLGVICTGRMVGMVEAKKVGVIDDIVAASGNVLDLAKKWAQFAENMGNLQHRTTCQRNVFADDDAKGKKDALNVCQMYANKLPSVEKGGLAVHAALKAVQASFTKSSFEKGMEVETELFWDLLLNSQQGRGLRHAFFAERSAQKVSKSSSSSAGSVTAGSKQVAQTLLNPKKGGGALVGVVGAGTMGSGIAICFLRAGYKVILVDNSSQGLDRGSKLITNVLQQDVKKKRISAKQAAYILSNNFSTTTDMTSTAGS